MVDGVGSRGCFSGAGVCAKTKRNIIYFVSNLGEPELCWKSAGAICFCARYAARRMLPLPPVYLPEHRAVGVLTESHSRGVLTRCICGAALCTVHSRMACAGAES